MAIKMSGNLNKLFDEDSFRQLSRDTLNRFGKEAVRNGVNAAKVFAPVGDENADPPDPHPGLMRDSIYGKLDTFPERIRVIVAIANPPVDYAAAVVHGSRRHKPNNFMERAKTVVVKLMRNEIRNGFGMGKEYWKIRNARHLASEG